MMMLPGAGPRADAGAAGLGEGKHFVGGSSRGGSRLAGPSPISVFDAFASPGVSSGAKSGGAEAPGSALSEGSGKSPGGIRSLRTHLVACHSEWPVGEC